MNVSFDHLCALFALSVAVGLAEARPVSYPGGITLMQNNDADVSSLHLHYSPTARESIGYRGEYWRAEQWQFHGAQYNRLLKRWNRPTSQANFYFKGALGWAISDLDELNNKQQPAGFVELAADWEDRRYFVSYENRYTEAGSIKSAYTQKARIGFAPYIGDYGDLHTWFMVQVDHTPTKDDQTSVTPLFRFFKNEYLAEIGVNDQGQGLFNLIIRY
ncbi:MULTISPECIES: hypothetical protein [unclassified Oleiphilus]|uniref:hypothetical protein n=1 Tax=unclassified Oleiphilus TaxID=2631174 RepID=UPI0007C3F5A3|nr:MULTISPECIES: hypothetical protein [unclassified Oleiphilus]KZY61775.1 hypothetical protein A3738_02970 [Oleiphilus sp. HI0066]